MWLTDGGSRADGTFVRLPAHSAEVLTEAFRRHALRLFVERELFEPEVADNMLDWLHSGFSVHDGVWLDQDDAAAHERWARYCARCPVSLERLAYDAETGTVTYTSDKPDGPAVGRHTFQATTFIARLVAHIPDKGQVMQRYCGYYANRTRRERRQAEHAVAAEATDLDGAHASSDRELPFGAVTDVTIVKPADFSHSYARRR